MSGSLPRWSQRPLGSTWGDFGPDDQLGRLNLLTPDKVRQGVAEVQDGSSFCLSLPLDYPGGNVLNPNRHPPVLRPTLRQGRVNFNFRFSELIEGRTDVVSDDLAILHLQYSTQWDGLAHVGSMFDADGDGLPEPVYYNGYRANHEVIGPPSHQTLERKAQALQVHLQRMLLGYRTWQRRRCKAVACSSTFAPILVSAAH
jgi:hypothetical protein